MTLLTRIPLEGGGYLLVEAPADSEGLVKAARGFGGDFLQEAPRTLQEALEPVTQAAQTTLDQLREARPDQVTVTFGVDLAVEAGAVITKGRATCHLQVTMSWQNVHA
ncbi:CU044_2847 family protein [Streptomyces sp. NPDC046881]|uniref:CU044_2847 family protein n=1 Tax=Streptomyces sp. NPDC046881 TaxID=3155374 RepID=UPI0033C4E0FA